MTTLTDELILLKKKQEELEKRIQEEEEIKKKLNNDASIERLEELVKPISNTLEHKRCVGTSNNEPIWGKTRREMLREEYEQETRKYNIILLRNPQRLDERRLPPIKSGRLLTEEIYVTLIGILKKQDERIKDLERKLGY
jgi:hypothetical protein